MKKNNTALEEMAFWDDLAVKSYKWLLKKNPKASFAHMHLALVYMRTNREQKALRSLERAIACDKTNGEAFYHMGMLLLRQDREKEAKRCFSQYHNLQDKG